MGNFNCPFCPKSFNHQALFKRHLLTHTGEKPFTCDTCGRGFNQKSSLKRHELLHTNEKPFKCDVCLKGFTERSKLTKHMIVHTEDRPFRCDTCGKRFKAKEYLKQHAKSHNKTRRSQYCPICNIEYFVSDDTLRYHIEQDHPGIPWPQSAIRTEEIPGVGRVSCVTHTFTTPTGVVTASSMISSPFGNVVYTQTTSTATRTSTRTSTSTSTGTSTSTSTSTTTTQAHYPLETATIGQSSDSFSLPANPISDDLDLYKILDEKDKDFAQWRFDPNASD